MSPNIDEIEERVSKATKGPWSADEGDGWVRSLSEPVAGSRIGLVSRNAEPNAEFIAHAREDVPDLLAELKAAQEKLGAALRKAKNNARSVRRARRERDAARTEADGVVAMLWGRLTKEEIDIMSDACKQRVYQHLDRILGGD